MPFFRKKKRNIVSTSSEEERKSLSLPKHEEAIESFQTDNSKPKMLEDVELHQTKKEEWSEPSTVRKKKKSIAFSLDVPDINEDHNQANKNFSADNKREKLTPEMIEKRKQRTAKFLEQMNKRKVNLKGRGMYTISVRDLKRNEGFARKVKKTTSLEDLFSRDKSIDSTLAIKWKEFVQSLPKNEIKHTHFKNAMKADASIMKDGQVFIGALQKMEVQKGGTFIPPPPPPPDDTPQKANLKEKVDIFCFNHVDEMDYHEMFGLCSEEPDLYVWRIENKLPKQIDRSEYGKFFSNDSYIILNYDETDPKESVNIHTWIGKYSTVDKKAICAIRCIELSRFLHKECVHHREEEGDESDLFVSYFLDCGITYMEGGTFSNFRDYGVDPISVSHLKKFPPRLYCIQWISKPKRKINVVLVELSLDSLNSCDCFFVDTGEKLLIWSGPQADNLLVFLTSELVNSINQIERNMECNIINFTAAEGVSKEDIALFWGFFGEDRENIPSDSEKIDDTKLLIKTGINQDTQKLELVTVNSEEDCTVRKEWLDSGHSFILDCYSEVYVWLGKKSSIRERKLAKDCAKVILANDNRPSYSTLDIVIDGAEGVLFKKKFESWHEKTSLFVFPPSIPRKKKPEVEVLKLFQNPIIQEEENQLFLSNEIEGNAEVWILDKLGPTFIKLENEERGIFYSSDTYMVLYTYYDKENNQQFLAYFWEGQDASKKWWASWSAGFFPNIEKKIIESGSPRPSKQKIIQMKESRHFMSIFQNTIIIHKGKRKERIKNEPDSALHLYHIREKSDKTVRAIEIDAEPARLNSLDSFILTTRNQLFIWFGKRFDKCKLYNQVMNIALKLQLKREIIENDEGIEHSLFWDSLGKGDYQNENFHTQYSRIPRLFCASTKTGAFTVREILEYNQSDLTEDEIYILNTFHELYVIIGNCSECEKNIGLSAINKYAESISHEKSKIPVIDISKDNPYPFEFVRHFYAWNDKHQVSDPRQLSLSRFHENKRQEESHEKDKRDEASEHDHQRIYHYPLDYPPSFALYYEVLQGKMENHEESTPILEFLLMANIPEEFANQYTKLLSVHQIDTSLLLELNNRQMKEIGILSVGHRLKIQLLSKKLKEDRSMQTPNPDLAVSKSSFEPQKTPGLLGMKDNSLSQRLHKKKNRKKKKR